MTRREVLLPLFVLCLLGTDLVPTAHSIWLRLPPSGTKCVSEEIHGNVVVLADYVLVADQTKAATISVKVTSPFGNNLHLAENVTSGHFAFTTTEAGNYLACFWLNNFRNQPDSEISVNLDWRAGIAAKDWETIAKKEKIEGVELELRKLEGAIEAIHENLLYLKDREADMRTVSERTNSRVAWYGIISVGVCIIASTLQIWHLKRFFLKKKLI